VRQIPIWRNGETLWSHAAERNPKSPVPFLGRALYYRNFTGDHARAFADLDRAAALDPRRQETFNQRADLLFELQRIDEAIAQYTKAIELGPRVPGPYASRAAAFASRGQMDLALRDLDRTLELDPHHLHGLMYRALALQQSGSYERALKDYDTYLQLHPGEGNMWYERGLCRRALGREHEAVSDFTEAIRLDPAGQFTPLYYLERARSRFLLGEHDAAREDGRQAKLRGAVLPPELDGLVR
jgi:tetratricopeptide (TPR) repeat protein